MLMEMLSFFLLNWKKMIIFWEYLIGVYKNGIIVKSYDLEIRCSYQIDDCIKEAQDIQFGVDKKIIISPQSKIIFPKEVLEKGAVSMGLRTTKYDRKSSHLSFCVKNNKLITSNDLDFLDLLRSRLLYT